jgi:hypothetical protein
VLVDFGSVWYTILFILCFIVVLVDIVPMSTEQPIGVDEEQFFEEEQYEF